MNWRTLAAHARTTAGALAPAIALLFLPPATPPATGTTGKAVCACCADPGVWSLETRRLDQETLKELNRLKSSGEAEFHATAAWPEDISGIALPEGYEPRPLTASVVREGRTWKFLFKTSSGQTGALTLTLPGTATFFHADIEQRRRGENTPPSSIYNEIRLEGTVRGTGMFAKGNAPATKFRLVLQGRGNMCVNAEDFHRWNLRILGPQAGYALYGFFESPSK